MKEVNAAHDIRLRILDVLLQILLPLSFIALKLMGSFIDFMLALGVVNYTIHQYRLTSYSNS